MKSVKLLGAAVFLFLVANNIDDVNEDPLPSLLQVLTQKLGRSKCALQETLLRLSRSNMHKAGQVRTLSYLSWILVLFNGLPLSLILL